MAFHIGLFFPDILHDKWSGVPTWLNTPVITNYESEGWFIDNVITGSHSSTQPVSEKPSSQVGFKLPTFSDDFYNRILIEPSVIDAGNLIGEQFYEVSVFNGYFEDKELLNLIFDNTVGINLSGSPVGTIWGPIETKSYQLSILPDGPPIIQSEISFDWAGISDDISISVVGTRIVMLPFQAETPWRESYEWKTNVLQTNSGLEQRIRLRKAPRQYVEAKYPVDYKHSPMAINMINGWVGKRWALGMWSETQLIASLVNGVSAIPCDTTKADFREDGMVLIWESVDKNEALEIESITPTQINLKRTVVGIYTNAVIMPVRMGMPKGGIISRSTNGYNSQLSVSYAITDNALIPSPAPQQYLGNDIYWDVSLIGDGNSLEEQVKTRQNEVDYETGIIEYSAPWKHPKRARNVSFLNEGPEECWIFKQWLNRRCGRLRPYWLPTFEDNLVLQQEGIVNSSLICLNDGYKTLGKDHNHIAVLLNDGTWMPRAVTGISNGSAGLIHVAMDSPLFVDASLIRTVCFLGLHRLDTDIVEVYWTGNNINQSSIRILEYKL